MCCRREKKRKKKYSSIFYDQVAALFKFCNVLELGTFSVLLMHLFFACLVITLNNKGVLMFPNLPFPSRGLVIFDLSLGRWIP